MVVLTRQHTYDALEYLHCNDCNLIDITVIMEKLLA
jgi:hypothetical protein